MVRQPTGRESAVHPITMGGTAGNQQLDGRVVWFIRDWIETYAAAHPGEKNPTIGRMLRVTRQTIGDVRTGKRGVGYHVARGLARHLGITVEELEAQAMKEHAARGEDTSIVYDRDPKLAATALGNHREWQTARDALVAFLGESADVDLIDGRMRKMPCGQMPEHLTADVMMSFYASARAVRDALATEARTKAAAKERKKRT